LACIELKALMTRNITKAMMRKGGFRR